MQYHVEVGVPLGGGFLDEIGVRGLLVKVVGIGWRIVRRVGEEQLGDAFANALVGDGERARIGVDLDRVMIGDLLLRRQTIDDQVRRVDLVAAKRLDPALRHYMPSHLGFLQD